MSACISLAQFTGKKGFSNGHIAEVAGGVDYIAVLMAVLPVLWLALA